MKIILVASLSLTLVLALGCNCGGSPTPAATTFTEPTLSLTASPYTSATETPALTTPPSPSPQPTPSTTLPPEPTWSPPSIPTATPTPTPAPSPTPFPEATPTPTPRTPCDLCPPSSPTSPPTPTPTPIPSPEATIVSVRPAHSEVGVGTSAQVDVIVESAANLYAVDIRLSFDATIVQVQDADPGKSGVQVEPGTFLNPGKGWLFQNAASNEAGRVWFVITLFNPAPPVSGAGTLFTVTFQGKAPGTSQLGLENIQLVSLVEGKVGEIASTARGGTLVVTP